MLNIGVVCEVVNVNKDNWFKSGFVAADWIGGKVVVIGIRENIKRDRHLGRRLHIAYDCGGEIAIGYAWEVNLKQVEALTLSVVNTITDLHKIKPYIVLRK